MTKHEFAIKLLFWLMPWPLSKQLPRILLRIFDGPAGPTPSQWDQAAYDGLTQYFSDITAYAADLLDIIIDVPPTEQLTAANAALTAAIENASRFLSALTEIMAHLEDYTPEQILQAFTDATYALLDLGEAIDALIHAIQQLPPEDIPDIPLPTPPPYIPPVPPVYPPPPGPGQPPSTYPSRKSTRWFDYTAQCYWDDVETVYIDWVDDHWYVNTADVDIWFYRLGTWPAGFRPTKARITFDCDLYEMVLSDALEHTIVGRIAGQSGVELECDFLDNDLNYFKLTARTPGNITKIEFYGKHVSCT